jgi:hypothetical protein
MVTIKVIPDLSASDSTEAQWAHRLKEILETSLRPNDSGEITIHASVTCYGYGDRVNDVDIVVFGQFNPGLRRTMFTRVKEGDALTTPAKETVFFNDFCIILEVKSSPAGRAYATGQHLIVRYGDGEKDATEQNEQQKQAFRKMLEGEHGLSCHITNLIWLTSFAKEELPQGPRNLIGHDVTLDDLLKHILRQRPPFRARSGPAAYFATYSRDRFDTETFHECLKRWQEKVIIVGSMTREKVERITQGLLHDQQYAKEIGRKLVLVRGRAGTGKTIKLLRIAHDLIRDRAARVVLLTYNKALASDIKRLCYFTKINSGTGTFEVRTIHSYLHQLVQVAGVDQEIEIRDFLTKYDEFVEVTLSMLADGTISTDDKAQLLRRPGLSADYVLVDEGQDWPENEQELLFQLYGTASLVVTDGIDQLVRRPQNARWIDSAGKDNCHLPPPEKKSLRQKPNLNIFNRAFCDAMGVEWELRNNDSLQGGQVIIVDGPYTQALHDSLYAECMKSGNLAYEQLMMVPPTLVNREDMGNGKVARHFLLLEEWEEWGLRVWDGTNPQVRKDYPNDPNEFRVVQYDSCRGLEGWIGVCHFLDDFFSYKQREWEAPKETLVFDIATERRRFAAQWCMIPFTRAIDTLVITLNDKSSYVRSVLRAIYEDSGIVEWRTGGKE